MIEALVGMVFTVIGLWITFLLIFAAIVWIWSWPWATILAIILYILLALFIAALIVECLRRWRLRKAAKKEAEQELKNTQQKIALETYDHNQTAKLNRPQASVKPHIKLKVQTPVGTQQPERVRLKVETKPFHAANIKKAAKIFFWGICAMYWLVCVAVFFQQAPFPQDDKIAWVLAWLVMVAGIPWAVYTLGKGMFWIVSALIKKWKNRV